VLLTGATGFVGRHLLPALEARGCEVRCASRRVPERQSDAHTRDWCALDVESGRGLDEGLASCDAAFYLVHSMAAGGDYERREADAAVRFREAAARAGVARIVYLGGVAPTGEPSKHLRSRLETGRLLRAGPVPCVELRAAMIVGSGSESWQIVRDLARRLPAMVLPAWLRNRSCPVFIDDLAAALVRCLEVEVGGSVVLEAPGPERVRHKDLLRRVAAKLGSSPWMIDVPVLSPALSSLWIGLVTDADLTVARELVHGLVTDLLPTGQEVWGWMPGYPRTSLDRAIELALADDGAESFPTAATRRRIEDAASTRLGT
jgi:uncharacterized protein YbjT (DUF2867 family)